MWTSIRGPWTWFINAEKRLNDYKKKKEKKRERKRKKREKKREEKRGGKEDFITLST